MRYTRDELMRLRQSPLVLKPPGLPPAEEWMGSLPDNARSQGKIHPERSRVNESSLQDHTNRRPGLDRHLSRTTTNPEDIVLGPPKTSFASATLRNSKTLDSSDRPSISRDVDSRDRLSFRRGGDSENERGKEGRNSNLRSKRVDGDQDSDGWSTVKPRKSFGTEGAERFSGRMGGDRHREDRRIRDRDERDTKDRPVRGFDVFSRDKDPDSEQDGTTRRNGFGRGRNEPTWFKDGSDTLPASAPAAGDRRSNGDRFADRTRGWRDKDRDERGGDRVVDRGGDRGDERGDRRRDRDRWQERDPEWMDEPDSEKPRAKTQEDFQKWKESMNAGNNKAPAADETPSSAEAVQESFFGLEKAKVETPLVVEAGPDKFFGMWSQPSTENASDNTQSSKDGAAKIAPVGKSSRFKSLFAAPAEEPQRRATDPPPPLPASPAEINGQSSKEKEDFAKLLMKLQSHSVGPGPPPMSHPQPTMQPNLPNVGMPIQGPFPTYGQERQDVRRPVSRESQTAALQDLLGNRSTAVSQPSSRPEQMVHDLVNQRQGALSQASSRPDQESGRNAAFLMGLMRAAPEPLRVEQLMMRVPPQPQPDRQMQQQMNDREQEMHREQRERSASQRQRRPDLPPGFYEDGPFQRGPPPQHDVNNPSQRSGPPPQPTQILQRPPPGLDQLPPGWGAPNAQLPPPISQQRHIAPPPGLAGGIGRGMPMPQNMFPPGFPLGGFGPPPDGMGGAPRMPPPPGFMMPPPGFMGGPPMNGFQGPDGMAFGPFDGRGAPQGNFRRP